MESNAIEFISRVYIKEESKYPKLRVVAKILAGLYIIMFICTFIIYGFSLEVIKNNLISLFLVFNLFVMTSPKEGFKDTVVRIDFSDYDMIITYNSIDRHDRMGPRMEVITINYNNITKLEYIKEVYGLNIQGYPIEKVRYLKEGNQNEYIINYLEKNQEKSTIIYFSSNEKNKILNILREKTNIELIELS